MFFVVSSFPLAPIKSVLDLSRLQNLLPSKQNVICSLILLISIRRSIRRSTVKGAMERTGGEWSGEGLRPRSNDEEL